MEFPPIRQQLLNADNDHRNTLPYDAFRIFTRLRPQFVTFHNFKWHDKELCTPQTKWIVYFQGPEELFSASRELIHQQKPHQQQKITLWKLKSNEFYYIFIRKSWAPALCNEKLWTEINSPLALAEGSFEDC